MKTHNEFNSGPAKAALERQLHNGKIMDFEEMTDQEILAIANPIMNNLMEASTEIDHERHVRDFTHRIKEIVTEEYLKKVCEKYQSEKGFFHQA